MKKIIVIIFLSLFITGCIDFEFEEEAWFIDTVAVSRSGKVALCLDKEGVLFWTGVDTEVYITDLRGSFFTRVTENEMLDRYVAWSDDERSLLYTEEDEEVWKLNLYSLGDRQSINLLQEMYQIALPSFSSDLENVSYMVFPDEKVPFGHLNIYEKESSSIYTLIENAYYDYEWMPYAQKIAAVNVVKELEEGFQGRLLIKDIQGFTEEVVFSGYFVEDRNAVDITPDGKTIVFNASDTEKGEVEIYLYNIENETLTKWNGPDGYEFRLPAYGLCGYILAHVKGQEDGWNGQLYLVSLDKKIIEVPGSPIWIKEPNIVYMDLYEGIVMVLNLDTGEIVNLTQRFKESRTF